MPITGLTFSGVPIGESGYNPWSPSANFGSGSDVSQEELYRRAQEELLNNANQYPDVDTSPYDTQMAGLTQQQLGAQKTLNQPESKTSKYTNGIMGLLSAIAMIRDMTNKNRKVRAKAPRNVMAGMDVLKQSREEAQRKKQDEYTRTMQAIQAQKEDVQNSIRTAMSKAELKSVNTARKANALSAVDAPPVKGKPPSADELSKVKLEAAYDDLVAKHPGASMKDLAQIAHETDARLYTTYFSKDYPISDPEESLDALKEKYRKYFSDFYQAEIANGTPVNEAIIKATAMRDALMAAEAGPGDYQPPPMNLTPPQFPNNFDVNQVPWLKLQEERKRRGGKSYKEYNEQFQPPVSSLEKSSYYRQ